MSKKILFLFALIFLIIFSGCRDVTKSSDTIAVGSVYMKSDGILEVTLSADNKSNVLNNDLVIEVSPGSDIYEYIMDQVGGVALGERKALYEFSVDEGRNDSPRSRHIGVVFMTSEGVLQLTLSAEIRGDDHTIGDIYFERRPGDDDYEDIILHVGGLNPGESKLVPPWEHKK